MKRSDNDRINLTPSKLAIIPVIALLLLAAFSMTASASKDAKTEKPIVVATSSNLGYFADAIGNGKINVLTLVPAGVCPGHYDTRPGDVSTIGRADLVLWNGFEPWLNDLLKSSGNTDVVKNKGPKGPWGLPPGGEMYVENTAKALAQAFPQYEDTFEKRKENLLNRIDLCAENLKGRAEEKNIENFKVICQRFQKPYVSWLGFDVVETYPSPEQITPDKYSKIVRTANREDVGLVIKQ